MKSHLVSCLSIAQQLICDYFKYSCAVKFSSLLGESWEFVLLPA